LSSDVDAIVLRALRKDPTRRFASAGALAQAMTDWRQYGKSGQLNPSNAGDAARPLRPGAAPRVPNSTRQPQPNPQVAAPLATAGASEVGCATWLVGTAIVLGLIVLTVVGFQLSERLTASDAPDPTATAGAALAAPRSADLADPTATAPAATEPAAAIPAPTTPPTSAAAGIGAPDLIGLSEADAVSAANARGFVVDVGDSVYSESIKTGLIAEQDPPPDRPLAQGATIFVKPSRGSPSIDLAALDLIGLSEEEARGALAERGLGAETELVGSPDQPEGRVVAIVPADTAMVGETITMQISAGDKVQVPAEIIGRPVEQAIAQLESLEFQVSGEEGIDRDGVAGLGVDMATDAIVDGDAVGVSGAGADIGAWLDRGATLTVLVYDQDLDAQA
jgi:serine/threonine-protein kinase